MEGLEFLGSFLRNPLAVGAFWPSSRFLARAMLADCDLRNARVVVELGPGTGAFTGLIIGRLGGESSFLGVELDSGNVRRLRERFEGLEVHQVSAERLPMLLERFGGKADCVISGLPWANMGAALQDRILDAVLGSLSQHGVFTTFSYVHARVMPGSWRFRQRLTERFGSVRISPVVWRNVPPAYVYCCRRPVPGDGRGWEVAPES
jgi:phospholipid N-methyltransferase